MVQIFFYRHSTLVYIIKYKVSQVALRASQKVVQKYPYKKGILFGSAGRNFSPYWSSTPFRFVRIAILTNSGEGFRILPRETSSCLARGAIQKRHFI